VTTDNSLDEDMDDYLRNAKLEGLDDVMSEGEEEEEQPWF
jgi:hypothetical protein